MREQVAQLPTGVPGLDILLNGGLRASGLHVVVGGPGMGKSVLAHQIGANRIRDGGRVLYLTSLVEAHQTLISQARTFDFFDASMVPRSFYYASLYPSMTEGGLHATREEVTRLVAQQEPSLVVIDGVHALKNAAQDALEYQRFVHEMEAMSAVTGLASLMLVHPPADGIASDPVFTIADAILHMRAITVRMREVRIFAVGKLRGVHHIDGWHTFRIGAAGVHIYPRAESLPDEMAAPLAHASSGEDLLKIDVTGMDEMLGGGLDRGTTTLVVGTPGSGKTLTGLAYLTAGADAGEPGVLMGYHEAPETLMRRAEGVGLPLRRHVEEGRIHLTWKPPGELLVDEEVERLLQLVRAHRIQRVVIDAVEDLRYAVVPRQRELYALASLMNLLRGQRATTLILHNLKRVIGVNFDLPLAQLSAMMDNAVHMRYVEQQGELKRLIAILKVRARAHDHLLREFRISNEGISIGTAFDRGDLILTGLGLSQ